MEKKIYKKPAIRMCAAILPSLVCDSPKTYSGALGSKERDDEEEVDVIQGWYDDIFIER